MNTHRRTIETAWEDLLEAVADAAKESKASSATENPESRELAGRLDTLYAALHGLGNAWSGIRDLLPDISIEEAAKSDMPGALPQSAYWRPLAETLHRLGGSATTQEAITEVGKELEGKLQRPDWALFESSGQIRWMVNVRFARHVLKKQGLILAGTPHGTWSLTEAGERWAADPAKPSLPRMPIPQPNPAQPELFDIKDAS